jgi:sensor histidine kinase YesM
MIKRLTRYEAHVLFWICLILVFSVVYGLGPESSSILVLAADHLMSLPFYLISSYLIAYVFIPVLLFKHKYFLFSGVTVALILLFAFAELIKTSFVSMPLLYPEMEHKLSITLFDISRAAFYILLPSVFFIAIKYLKNWYTIKIVKNELEKEHLKNELKILKSQLHPSFLIDTLDILKSRAEKKPVEAAEGIEQVSELLSFILYEFNTSRIEIEKEIRLIETFISLQELNRDVELDINYSIIGNKVGIEVPPLLLFSLVEYLFKNLAEVTGKVKIQLFLEIQNNNIDFWVECNDCPDLLNHSQEDRNLLNLKKRLKIIYPGNHRFEIKQRKDLFILHMNFNIA